MNDAGSARGLSCSAAASLLVDDWRFGGLNGIRHFKRQLFKHTNHIWNQSFGLIALLTFFSMALIASAGFAINDILTGKATQSSNPNVLSLQAPSI